MVLFQMACTDKVERTIPRFGILIMPELDLFGTVSGGFGQKSFS